MNYESFILQIILCHFFGDYVFQSAWISEQKKTKFWSLIIHCIIYTGCICYALLGWLHEVSWSLLAVIFLSHMVTDKFRIWYEKKGYLFITPNRIFGKSDWLPTFIDQILHLLIIFGIIIKLK